MFGAGSIATGSVILAGDPHLTSGLRRRLRRRALRSEGSPRPTAAGVSKRAVPTSSDPGMVATIVGLAPAPLSACWQRRRKPGEAGGCCPCCRRFECGAAPASSGGASAARAAMCSRQCHAIAWHAAVAIRCIVAGSGLFGRHRQSSGPGTSPVDKPATPQPALAARLPGCQVVLPAGGNTLAIPCEYPWHFTLKAHRRTPAPATAARPAGAGPGCSWATGDHRRRHPRQRAGQLRPHDLPTTRHR